MNLHKFSSVVEENLTFEPTNIFQNRNISWYDPSHPVNQILSSQNWFPKWMNVKLKASKQDIHKFVFP